MFDSHLCVEFNCFRDKVCVEFVETLVEQSSEVARQFIGLLEARAQAISESCDVRNMHVFRQLRLFLDRSLEFCFSISEQPFEYCLLDLLVIFFLEKLILKERHRA